jgi:hypothetical protein
MKATVCDLGILESSKGRRCHFSKSTRTAFVRAAVE